MSATEKIILGGAMVAGLWWLSRQSAQAAGTPATTAPSSSSTTPAQVSVADAQSWLQSQGLYSGATDGSPTSPGFVTALVAFQQAHGLSQSGILDTPTRTALIAAGLVPASSAPASATSSGLGRSRQRARELRY